MTTSFSDDDSRLDQRLSLLWDKLTRNSRAVREILPRLRTIERRLDRLEARDPMHPEKEVAPHANQVHGEDPRR